MTNPIVLRISRVFSFAFLAVSALLFARDIAFYRFASPREWAMTSLYNIGTGVLFAAVFVLFLHLLMWTIGRFLVWDIASFIVMGLLTAFTLSGMIAFQTELPRNTWQKLPALPATATSILAIKNFSDNNIRGKIYVATTLGKPFVYSCDIQSNECIWSETAPIERINVPCEKGIDPSHDLTPYFGAAVKDHVTECYSDTYTRLNTHVLLGTDGTLWMWQKRKDAGGLVYAFLCFPVNILIIAVALTLAKPYSARHLSTLLHSMEKRTDESLNTE